MLSAVSAQPTLLQRVIEAQLDDDEARRILPEVLSESGLDEWRVRSDQGLRYWDRLFVPVSCRDNVLHEFHHSRFARHPGGNKMYQDLRRQYWWKGMKADVTGFVARCLVC